VLQVLQSQRMLMCLIACCLLYVFHCIVPLCAVLQVLQFQSMLMAMLRYDPATRPSAAELLQHEFLQDKG
jgi:hypothetical protein